jgi:DNA polymerase
MCNSLDTQTVNSDMEKKWIILQSEIKNCFKCRLHTQGVFPIFGDGPITSKIVFIGEAPGFKENQLKKPFVGRSGQILNDFLSKIELSRNDVFISNIIKCRPPKNRDPFPDEIASCTPYLSLQMKLLPVKIVVTLGRFAAKFFHEDFSSMTEIAGKIFQKDGYSLLPMYHPATCLYHPQKYLSLFERDFFILKELLIEYALFNEKKAPNNKKRKELVGLDRFF